MERMRTRRKRIEKNLRRTLKRDRRSGREDCRRNRVGNDNSGVKEYTDGEGETDRNWNGIRIIELDRNHRLIRAKIKWEKRERMKGHYRILADSSEQQELRYQKITKRNNHIKNRRDAVGMVRPPNCKEEE